MWKWGRMHVILNGVLSEEVDCLKYRGCERDVAHRMNKEYRVGRAEKCAEQ